MNFGTTETSKFNSRWFIDNTWFEQNSRSLSILVQRCLCTKCYQKLKPDSQFVSIERLMKAVKDCCSKEPEFIRIRMPVLESVFRLLLANGNKPISPGEILQQLGERCGVGLYHLSSVALYALLSNDQYYGLTQNSEK